MSNLEHGHSTRDSWLRAEADDGTSRMGRIKQPGELCSSRGQNIELHKAVMRKIAENGGKVPDSMKS